MFFLNFWQLYGVYNQLNRIKWEDILLAKHVQ